jgi:Transposase DDE domain
MPGPGDLRPVVEAGADLLVRVGWNALRLLTPDGAAFDLFAALAAMAGEDGEACVRVDERKPGSTPGPVWRLVMHRKTPE